jgi:hypothetical protein
VEGGQFGRSICHTTTHCELTYCLPQRREKKKRSNEGLSFDGALCENLEKFYF